MMHFNWFFDFKKDPEDKIFDQKIGYIFNQDPRKMTFEQSYLKQMYQFMIKNNGISYKDVDKILLKSTNCFSLLFHKNLNENKIIFEKNYYDFKKIIKSIIIKICQKNNSKIIGKCSEKNYSKIKTILIQLGLYDFLSFNELDVIMICYLFSKRSIKQTKLIIKNCHFENLQMVKKFPKLFFKHNENGIKKFELYLLIKLILDEFKQIKYINFRNEFLKFQRLLKTGLIFYCQYDEQKKIWKGRTFKV